MPVSFRVPLLAQKLVWACHLTTLSNSQNLKNIDVGVCQYCYCKPLSIFMSPCCITIR
jgi:hypothetical protein